MTQDRLAENKQKYRELCAHERSIQVYIQDWWLDAVCGESHWDVLISYDKDQSIQGTFALHPSRKWGMRCIIKPQFCQNTGLWLNYPEELTNEKRLSFEKEVCYDLINQLEEYAREHRILFAEITLDPRYTNWLPFYWRGFRQCTRYTYRILHLQERSNEEILTSFDRSKRKNIKRALEQTQLRAKTLTAEAFYRNHKYTLSCQKQAISYSKELFERMYQYASERKNSYVVCIEDQAENIHAALFIIKDKEVAYDLISTIDPNFRDSGASSLAVLKAIEIAQQSGLETFDFEGSMIEGVENSFRKFGSLQVPYFYLNRIFTKNPLLRRLLRMLLY